MRVFCAAVLLAFAAVAFAQSKQGSETLRVKIEGPEWDKKLLVEKLNRQGPGQGLTFELADQDFAYRITFALGRGSLNASRATATVYDGKGASLFGLERQRFTDPKATEAVAKEIIKRLLALRSQAAKKE